MNVINVGNLFFSKPQICCKFTPIYIQFSILCCDNVVLMLWLGLDIKPTWLGGGRDHVFDLKYKHGSKCCDQTNISVNISLAVEIEI